MKSIRIALGIALLLALFSTSAFATTLVGPWKPGLTHRPRLLWEADEWGDITARLDREPYATLYARVLSRSNGSISPRPQYYDPPREYLNANLAKNAAFVWAVDGDAAKAEKAAHSIIRAVEKNKRRALIGPDAYAYDGLVRLLPSFYQPIAVGFVKRLMK